MTERPCSGWQRLIWAAETMKTRPHISRRVVDEYGDSQYAEEAATNLETINRSGGSGLINGDGSSGGQMK